jgi:putative ABC transport system permease protein
MTWIGELWRRLRYRLSGSRFDQDLAEEMRLHMDLRAAEKRARGISPDAADTAAQRQFGNVTRLSEVSREAWGWTLLDTLKQDLRYAMRTLAANPGFTATAVLSLALGIGANTAIFSILNAVILRSLPVEDPQSLVQIRQDDNGELTNPIWEQIRDHQQAFSGALAFAPERFNLASEGESHFARGLWVSGDYFRVLGVPAVQGRVFTADDDRRRGGPAGPVAVISYKFWKQNFPGDSSVIGKTVHLNRLAFEIIGVTPPWFTGLDVDRGYDVAIPLGCEPLLNTDRSALDSRNTWWLSILGRIAPGVSFEQATDRMRAIAPEVFRATVPQSRNAQNEKAYLNSSITLKPVANGFSATRRQYEKALLTLMAIAGLVLLIACANIANLLLARAAARQREFSVRLAIGASRWRIVRQLMTESLLLSLWGAGGGFLLASWGSRLLVRLISTGGNRLEIDLSPDLRLLAFTIGVAILTALLFGLAPAFRATRIGLNDALKENARGALHGSSKFNLGKALVTAQVALALVLLVGAGLFLGTLRNLLAIDLGFTRQNILLIGAAVHPAAVPKAERARVYQDVLEHLRAVPGVASAASSFTTPISNHNWNGMIYPEGFTATSQSDTRVFLNRVSPGYFETLRTPLLMGRDFSERDNLTAPLVMMINESAARRFFGSANPLGKTIGMDKRGRRGEKEFYEVIGVVKDSKYRTINEETRRIAYLASGQDPDPDSTINYEVRTQGPLERLVPSIRPAVSGVSRDISLEFRNLETQVNESMLQPRMVALLSTVFGSLALLLAMVGLYGVTTYSVSRRRGEIGIRMALGAQQRSVVWLILRGVAVMLAVGTALGLGASLAAGRLIATLLYGVQANDLRQLAGAAFTLAAATAVAAYLPARRASRLDPMTALREE